jgi:hypothetical protein
MEGAWRDARQFGELLDSVHGTILNLLYRTKFV